MSASPLAADDPRHGTTAGHIAHRKHGEQACAPCVAAKTRYEKTRNVYGPKMVPAIGTRRRIQALMAMGHSGAVIADAMGVTYQAVHKVETGTAPKIFRATAEKVATVYDRLCMTIPNGYHRKRIRNKAVRLGYLPPLAWDDIDNPNEQPATGSSRHRYTTSELAAEWDHLRRAGESIEQAAIALGVTVSAIEKACERSRKAAA